MLFAKKSQTGVHYLMCFVTFVAFLLTTTDLLGRSYVIPKAPSGPPPPPMYIYVQTSILRVNLMRLAKGNFLDNENQELVGFNYDCSVSLCPLRLYLEHI
jgi:hypothetical protein